MINTILTRLTSESPDFFKKVQKVAITLGSIGGAVAMVPTSMVALPAIVTTIAGYFAACGFVAALVAKSTVADPAVLEKKEEPTGHQTQSTVKP